MWECPKCGWTGLSPLIIPAIYHGEVVDIIDIVCPSKYHCSGDPMFKGTEDERDEWWFAYYNKCEGKSAPIKIRGYFPTPEGIFTKRYLLYLNDGTCFMKAEPKVADSILKVIRSYGIKTKEDLFKRDRNFALILSFIGDYALYGDHMKVLGLTG